MLEFDLPTLVYRDKLIAQIIIWRMERKRKSQGEILLGDATYHRELLAQRIGI